MNGCKDVSFDFLSGYYFGSECVLQESTNNNYLTSYYVNLSNLKFDRTSTSSNAGPIYICQYTLDKKFVRRISPHLHQGENSVELDSNYLYRFSYNRNSNFNVRGYSCNIGVGSMANELAFGKLTFLDEIGTIIPFVIPLIAFALGFLLLKKMIKRGNEGHA